MRSTDGKTGGRKRERGQVPPLLPKPARRSARTGAFKLTKTTPIRLPADPAPLDPGLFISTQSVRDRIAERTGLTLPIERSYMGAATEPGIELRLDPRATISPRHATSRDAFRLSVRGKSITIAAPSIHGLRYGLEALSQLVSHKGEIASVEILDQPDFLDRGIMLDVSRGKVPSRQTLKDLVDLLARLRLNVLMLYVEHTFAFRAHPEIGEGASPLDAETILALDAYAHERGVELVPCLQSLGHMEHILSLDRYSKLAESERRWSITPSRKESYDFLGELYDEFLPLFRSKRVNANCDEPFDLGRGQSEERTPDRTPGQLFVDHVSRLEQLAARHGKQLMVWADFALKNPGELDRIGRDVVLLDWWYEANYDFDRIRTLRRKGFEVWTCPGTSSWNCLFPRVETSVRNVSGWAEAGRQHGATGLLNTDWGDFGHYNALGLSLHSYAWGAQEGWSGPIAEADFDRAFGQHVFGARTGAVRSAAANQRIGKLYRSLGDIHDPGFTIANGSALQYLYFDALDRSFFLQHVDRKHLETSARKLAAAVREIERLELGCDPSNEFISLAEQEILWSAKALDLAIEKSLAALDYTAWRKADDRRTSLAAVERRKLATRLAKLATRQKDQLAELTRLWHARSEPSEFYKTRKRIRKSIASLLGGAKRLRENRPPRPVKPSDLAMLEVFNEVRREFGMEPR